MTNNVRPMRPLAEVLSAAIAKASERSFTCADCAEVYTGAPYDGRCCECAARFTARSPASRPHVLAAARVPARYRRPFTEPAPWPTTTPSVNLAAWRGDPWSVVISGPDIGTGKSMLAAELLFRAVAARGKGGAWVRAAELVAGIFGGQGQVGREVAHRFTQADVLVIDEIARAHSSAATWEALSEVVGSRWDWERPTILVTNATRQQLADAEPSAYDRLRDGLFVAVSGDSRRGG